MYVNADSREYDDIPFMGGIPENIKDGKWIGSNVTNLIDEVLIGPNSLPMYEDSIKFLLKNSGFNNISVYSSELELEDRDYFDGTG